jgi:hypothetical protein
MDFRLKTYTYTISGIVTPSNEEVLITLSGDQKDSIFTSTGSYSFTVDYGSNVSVKASASDYKFTPENRDYFFVDADYTDQNFTGTRFPDGVHVGITAFNGDLKTTETLETDGMLVLDASGYNRNRLNGFINTQQQDDNTALYAAMGKSIDILGNAELPKLDEVFLITFTDGLDNFSHNLSPTYNSAAIQSLIANNRVDSNKIQSFTVGFNKGMNNTVKQIFEMDLTDLASQPQNFFVSDDFDEISDYFTYISKQLVKVEEIKLLECKIPGPADNTKIRWTFDVASSEMTNTDVYIEATVRRQGTLPSPEFWLENITYGGLSSSSFDTDTLHGVNVYKNGNFDGVKFQFKNFNATENCSNIGAGSLKYWTYNSNYNLWINDIETNAGEFVNVGTVKKNIAVMLTLDCSSSLGTEFGLLKNSAQSFINDLHSDYHNTSATKHVVKVNVSPKQAGISVTFGGETKQTNAFGQAYFFDKYENDYNYTATFNNEIKGGTVCVYQPTEVALNFSDNVHSVIFQDWNNYVLKTEFVESGGSATAPSDPVRPGYIFEEWDIKFSNVTSDITITAVYRLNTVGINDVQLKNTFTLYPNPANKQIVIKTNGLQPLGRIQIIDMTGKLIKQLATKNTKKEIDVSALKSGIYFVKVGASTQKLVKR